MTQNDDPQAQDTPAEDRFVQEWTATLLGLLEKAEPGTGAETLLKECSAYHYRAAGMEALATQYRGNLAGFIEMLTEKWGWKVTVDPLGQVITADENKPDCVCPVARGGRLPVSGVLCHCSEGFARRMFTAVTGRPTRAKVVRSVLRGGASCVYQIEILG